MNTSEKLLNNIGGKMKLYVGNLPWSIDDRKLKELFSKFGDIEEAVLIKDKFSGRSKGFGFVTFTNDADAKKAIAEMHEKDTDGRPLTVSEAKPMVPRDNDSRRDNSRNGDSVAPMANPSQINGQFEDDDDEDIDTVDEALEDASDDEPATEDASEAEELTEDEEED
jgi:RNA recognition motif-containing protein